MRCLTELWDLASRVQSHCLQPQLYPVTLLHTRGESSLLPSHNRGLKYLLSHACPFALQKQPSSYRGNAFFPRRCHPAPLTSVLTGTHSFFLMSALFPDTNTCPLSPDSTFAATRVLPVTLLSTPLSHFRVERLSLSPPYPSHLTSLLSVVIKSPNNLTEPTAFTSSSLLTQSCVFLVHTIEGPLATPPAKLNSTDPLSWFLPHHYPNSSLAYLSSSWSLSYT